MNPLICMEQTKFSWFKQSRILSQRWQASEVHMTTLRFSSGVIVTEVCSNRVVWTRWLPPSMFSDCLCINFVLPLSPKFRIVCLIYWAAHWVGIEVDKVHIALILGDEKIWWYSRLMSCWIISEIRLTKGWYISLQFGLMKWIEAAVKI